MKFVADREYDRGTSQIAVGEIVIKVACGTCGKFVKSSDAWAGRTAKCPNCNAPIVFPAVDQATPAMTAPEERGSQGAAAARYSAQTKAAADTGAPAEKNSASTGDATAAAAAKRMCVCCGQATPANAENCVHCGEFLGVAAENRSLAEEVRSLPQRYEDFEESATAQANLIARLAGLLMVAVPLVGLIYEIHQRSAAIVPPSDIYAVWVMSLAVFGAPGLYIAIRGALGGKKAKQNRARGMVQLFTGLALLAVAIGLSVLSIWFANLVGICGVIGIGAVASGAVLAAMGFAAVISGRDLKAEMSEINLFGGG
jgi:hypothetical protein